MSVEQRTRSLGLAYLANAFILFAWVAFCVFGALVLGLLGLVESDEFGLLGLLGAGAYGVFGLASAVVASIQAYAGIQLRKGRGLLWAIAGLAANLVTLVLALYCAPFGLCLLIYAILTLADGEVREYLETNA